MTNGAQVNFHNFSKSACLSLGYTCILLNNFILNKFLVVRCGQVGFGSGVPAPLYVSYEQNEGVPVIVGSITIMASVLFIVGYAAYHSYVTRHVDYDTMM